MVSLYEFGSRLLDILEIIHRAGYVHNDLSLEKIVIGPNQFIPSALAKMDQTENLFDEKSVHIVDFEYMTPYIDFKTKNHLK